MTTAAIRQKLHNYLETADDKKIKAIYTLVEDEVNIPAEDYTDEFKAELERRNAPYETGSGKVVTSAESKKRIKELLTSAKKMTYRYIFLDVAQQEYESSAHWYIERS